MFLNPAKLKDEAPKASFILKDREMTVKLGRSFGALLNPEERQTVGFIAPMLTGKSALAQGIYEALGARYNGVAMAMLAVNGINEAALPEKNMLIRHFDMAVHPDEEDNIPAHWQKLDAGLDRPGVDLVEHALLCRDARFSYIFKMNVEDNQNRKADLYCSDAMAARAGFQEFLRSVDLA